MHLWIPKFTIPFKMPLDTSQCLPKSLCAVSSSNEKSRWSWSSSTSVMTLWDSVPFFLELFRFPISPITKTTTISKKAGYILYHITYIVYILYHWVLKSARFGGGITAWSFRGEFFGCKAWSFPQWRWDAEGRVVGWSGRAEEGEGDSETQKDIKTTQLGI